MFNTKLGNTFNHKRFSLAEMLRCIWVEIRLCYATGKAPSCKKEDWYPKTKKVIHQEISGSYHSKAGYLSDVSRRKPGRGRLHQSRPCSGDCGEHKSTENGTVQSQRLGVWCLLHLISQGNAACQRDRRSAGYCRKDLKITAMSLIDYSLMG